MRAFLFVVALLCFSFSSFAKDIEVSSEIAAATIYADRADVTRSAKVKIPKGEHVLIFKGLPVSIYPDSIRTRGEAKGAVTFGAVSHKRESHEDYIVPREKELNAQILTLQDQRHALGLEKQALNTGKRFLEDLGRQARLRSDEDIAEIDLKPESWVDVADTLTSKIASNLKEIQARDIKIRELDEKIRKARDELNGLRTGQKRSIMVSIPFESDRDTELYVDLTYQIPNVGWTPLYDARLDTKTGELDLIQYGSVWQRTGEDWSDIELTLSTARPSRGAGLPDLHPHWVYIISRHKQLSPASMEGGSGFASLSKSSVSSASVPMEMDSAYEMMDEEEPRKREVFVQSAQMNTEGYVGEYKITGPASVKSDGTQSKLLIGAFDNESLMQVQIKPQISREAYLVAQTTLKGDSPVLPGQVNLFRDGAFIGKTYVSMLRPDDETELSFGIDDNVTVTRNMLVDKRSEAGLISKENILDRHYVTEIKNLHKKPIDIAVLETIPASKDARIRVELVLDKTTEGYKKDVDDKKGLLSWVTVLQPSHDVKINLGWRVTWPKGENISGL